MIVTKKVHRGASVIAAIVMLLMALISVASSAISMITGSASASAVVFNLIIPLIFNTLTIIALFRGKKDTVAAVFFLIMAAYTLFRNVFGNIGSIISNLFLTAGSSTFDMMAPYSIFSGLIYLVSNLALLAFYVLLALECLKPGMVSGGKLKAMLLVLPICNIALSALAFTVMQLGYIQLGYSVVAIITSAVATVVFGIGTVLLGLAFSIPVYEKKQEIIQQEITE